MALTPTAPLTPAEKRAQRDAAEQDMHIREVDEAVRQSDFEDFMQNYGRKLLALVVVLLAGFGAYLFWQSRQEGAIEKDSETLVSALDQIDAGNLDAGSQRLAGLAGEGGAGAPAAARLLRAGLAQQQGKTAEAVKDYAAIAADSAVSAELRDLAKLREITLRYDAMDKGEVIAALKPLAVPGKPYFASAGELVAHAYLETGKKAEAGALFAQIAKDREVPSTVRARSRQMAGLLGIDAVDPEQVVAASRMGAAAPAEAPATAPAQ